MSQVVDIRNARHDDLDSMVVLLRELFTIETDFCVDESRQRNGLVLMLDGCGKHRCVKVATIDGRVVGMGSAQIMISTAEGGPVAMVEDVVVQRAHRRRGIGSRLLAAIEAWGIQRGLCRLQLLADRNNQAALDFYRDQGWLPTRLICWRRKCQAFEI